MLWINPGKTRNDSNCVALTSPHAHHHLCAEKRAFIITKGL